MTKLHNDSYIGCPSCSDNSDLMFLVNDINQRISDEIFKYYRCAKCKLIFLNPIPESLQSYYGAGYSAYQIPEDIEKSLTDYDLGKIEAVNRFALKGSLLEIGPGNGAFVYLANKAGFVVDAIEMDQSSSEFISEKIGIRRCINSSDVVGALGLLDGGYRAIVMWQVLEHLRDPWGTLSKLPNMLADDGLLFVAMPNPDAIQFRIFGRYWMHVDAPRHLSLIPSSLLRKKLEDIGLECVCVTTNDRMSRIFNTYGWLGLTLDNYLSFGKNKLLKKTISKMKVREYIYKLISPIQDLEGKGNGYLAIFRRRL